MGVLQPLHRTKRDFSSATSAGFQYIGLCLGQLPGEKEPSRRMIISVPEYNTYFFANPDWVKKQKQKPGTEMDRAKLEKAQREYDWAVGMIPNWGPVYNDPQLAAPLNLKDSSLKRQYLYLASSSSLGDPPAP